MAISASNLVVRYNGNASNSVPYVIPFPFLETAHIFVLIDGVLQSQASYAVTPPDGGATGSLVTNAPVAALSVVTIYRELPLTQPSVFQPHGAFPAKTNETAFDRLEMQIQQLNARINVLAGVDNGGQVGGGSGSVILEVPNWADATARGSVKPARAGQLGVQRDGPTVWVSQSTTTGDWIEFAPVRTNRVVLSFMADQGSPSLSQTQAAALLTLWNPDGALFGGDNSYNFAAGYNTDWNVFSSWVAAGKAWPALGNHDLDEPTWATLHAAKFPYLPGNKRYYKVGFGAGLVDVFVLNPGRDTSWNLLEPDGNVVGSIQHQWFVAQLKASRARWKIVMFHHPPISLVDATDNRIEPNMNWPEFAQVHMILCGHSHLLEVLKYNNVLLANVSAITFDGGTCGGVIQNSNSFGVFHVDTPDCSLWADDISHGIARIVATQEKLHIEIWSINDAYGSSRPICIREHRDFSVQPMQVNAYAVWGAGELLPATGVRYVTTITRPMMIKEVRVSSGSSANAIVNWTLLGGAVTLATGSIGAGASTSNVWALLPTTVIPIGTVVTLSMTNGQTNTRFGLEVELLFQRHS